MLLKIKPLRISARLTLLYASILISILFITSTFTVIGLYFSVYHQAGVEMRRTIAQTLKVIEFTDKLDESELPPKTSLQNEEYVKKRQAEDPCWEPPPRFAMALFQQGAIVPGVVIRITNDKGRLIFNNAEHYPSYEAVENAAVEDLPLWANEEMGVAIMDNFHFYFKDVNVTWRGREYTLHFMRMITAEKQFMDILTNGFFINEAGVLFGEGASINVGGLVASTGELKDINDTTKKLDIKQFADGADFVLEVQNDHKNRKILRSSTGLTLMRG
ncbi:MAG: hypothetical protein K6F62_00975 [Schwartzia sp.]|nr:hypothetical protein [Schwartzia sp. (in: firmicutes)]